MCLSLSAHSTLHARCLGGYTSLSISTPIFYPVPALITPNYSQLDEEYGRECDEAAVLAAAAKDAGRRNLFVYCELLHFTPMLSEMM